MAGTHSGSAGCTLPEVHRKLQRISHISSAARRSSGQPVPYNSPALMQEDTV